MAHLPVEFSDLEPFAEKWCLATERERYAARLGSTMEELEAFYEAIFPRVRDAMAFCDRFPLKEMPRDALDLLRMLYSFVVVSFAVELWHQPYVPNTCGTAFDRYLEPIP